MPAPKGVPHKKPTKEEQKQIEKEVFELLTKGVYKEQVKTIIADTWGLQRRSVERYISHARKLMREAAGKDDDEHRSDAYSFYTSVLSDPDASHRDKIKARERIDKLYGLDKPTVVHGKNVNVELTQEDLAEMSDDELADLERRLLNQN